MHNKDLFESAKAERSLLACNNVKKEEMSCLHLCAKKKSNVYGRGGWEDRDSMAC